MGPHEASIARQAYVSRQPMPDRIANAPELYEDLGLYLEAFLWLDTERSDGAIPWSRIINYALFNGFDREQLDDLLYFTKELDRVISKHRSDQIKAAGKTNSSSKPPPGKRGQKLRGK